MDAITPQTSIPATKGPLREQGLFNPVVDDLAELFQFSNLTKVEIDALWLEFKKVVYQGDPVGDGINGALLSDYIVGGVLTQYYIAATPA